MDLDFHLACHLKLISNLLIPEPCDQKYPEALSWTMKNCCGQLKLLGLRIVSCSSKLTESGKKVMGPSDLWPCVGLKWQVAVTFCLLLASEVGQEQSWGGFSPMLRNLPLSLNRYCQKGFNCRTSSWCHRKLLGVGKFLCTFDDQKCRKKSV